MTRQPDACTQPLLHSSLATGTPSLAHHFDILRPSACCCLTQEDFSRLHTSSNSAVSGLCPAPQHHTGVTSSTPAAYRYLRRGRRWLRSRSGTTERTWTARGAAHGASACHDSRVGGAVMGRTNERVNQPDRRRRTFSPGLCAPDELLGDKTTPPHHDCPGGACPRSIPGPLRQYVYGPFRQYVCVQELVLTAVSTDAACGVPVRACKLKHTETGVALPAQRA